MKSLHTNKTVFTKYERTLGTLCVAIARINSVSDIPCTQSFSKFFASSTSLFFILVFLSNSRVLGVLFPSKQNKLDNFEYGKQDKLDAFRENLQSVWPQKRGENGKNKNGNQANKGHLCSLNENKTWSNINSGLVSCFVKFNLCFLFCKNPRVRFCLSF